MARLIQPSFAGGEISVDIAARVDLSKRAVAVERAENFVARVEGGMASRPGQLFVARAKAATVRLLPFEFNTEQTFILELTDQAMRFHAQGGQIVEAAVSISGVTSTTITTSASHGYATGDEVYLSGIGGITNLNGRNVKVVVATATTFTVTDLDGGAITIAGTYTSGGTSMRVHEIATPYAEADLFELRYAQSGDVMTIVHPDYAPRELVRISNTNWTLSEIDFTPEQAAPTGLSVTIGGGTSTTTDILKYKVTAVRSTDAIESAPALSTTTHTITGVTQASPAVVTVSAAHGLVYGDEIYIDSIVGMTELNGRRFLVLSAPTTTTIELMSLGREPIDSTGYTAYTSGGVVTEAFFEVFENDPEWQNTVTWTVAAGAARYNVYRQRSGEYTFIGSSPSATFIDNFIAEDSSETIPTPFNPFEEGTDYYPSVSGFYQQRQIYANSNLYPNRFWMTQAGTFYNFSTASPLRDDDTIVGTIAARRINEIRHLVPLSDLLIMTAGAEYRVKGSGDAPFTPATINIKPQSFYGSTSLQPIVAGAVALFMTPGQAVREIAYEFASDKFTGFDISVLARHLFDYNDVVDWAFSPAPYSNIWCIRDDGTALILTYKKEQEVYAWTRATTLGSYKSVAVVREGDHDIPYFAVERTINGVTQTFVERLDERLFEVLCDAFCVDAGLSLDAPITITGATAANPVVITAPGHGLSNGDIVDICGIYEATTSNTQQVQMSTDYNGTGFTVANATTNTFELQNEGVDYDGSGFAAYSSGGQVRKAVTTVSGLWHLEGETVVAAANGYAETGLTVTNGQVTLDNPASKVHVGLPYTCQLITLPINSYVAKTGESTNGVPKNISSVTVQVERTMGMWAGPSTDQMRETKFPMPALYNQPLSLVTDDITVGLKSDWSKRKQVVIEQRSPLPMTVLALVPDVKMGGR